MKKTVMIFSVIVSVFLLLTSCTTFRSNYYVDGQYYETQEKGHFGRPADPSLPQDRVLEGWSIAGSDTLFEDWGNQPEGEVRFDAVIKDIPYISFYTGDTLFASMPETMFKDPGAPKPSVEHTVFLGWKAEGASDDELVTDWSAPAEDVYRYDAVFAGTVRFYVNGELWASVLDNDSFVYPGEPKERQIPRGYEFLGWVSEDDYRVYEGSWDKAPEAKRFDALLVRSEVDAANGFENQTLSLDLDRSIDILGPVTVEETYEIVDGKIEVGGIGYKDILKAAIDLYPEADQVINIITDYETVEYTIDAENSGAEFPEGETTVTFEVASYTGIAININ